MFTITLSYEKSLPVVNARSGREIVMSTRNVTIKWPATGKPRVIVNPPADATITKVVLTDRENNRIQQLA